MIFWTVFVVLCQWQSVLSQTTPIDVQKCTEYKKRVYERVESYGFFFHGAPTVNVTIDDCKRFDGLITNGEVANPKEFPVMARLGNFDVEAGDTEIKWFCGGTLISEKWVLTAAHCFRALQGEGNRVRLGELVFDSDKDDAQPEDFEVKQVIEHPDFDKDNDDSAYNDIGLVELSRNVNFSLYKHPACLPSTSGDEKSQFVAAGWGSTRFQDASSKQLMKVTLDYFSADRCHEIVKASPTFTRGLVRSQQLCAGGRRGDTCQGDSGGPLLAFHTYPCMYTLVGITSKGFVCGTPDIPGIYTRVYPYLSWIRSIVWP